MGNQLATRLHVDFMSELPKADGEGGEGIIFGSVLGGGRFLKTLQCWRRGSMVVVKAYSKRDMSQSLREYGERLESIRERLQAIPHPNVLPFVWFPETQRAAFLVRAYVHRSLRERMASRPLLTEVERQWFTFQLLTALEQCESVGLVHGDVKSSNILVTSWNWLVLSDLTGLKPGYIPEDNPADLSYFFDDDYHKRCYVAPERFFHSSSPESSRYKDGMTCAIDIFSSGCVISELFLGGESIFSLAQLLAYRKGDYTPSPKLGEIKDGAVREMAGRMISLDPSARSLASFYLRNFESRAFPSYFRTFLHPFVWKCGAEMLPDDSIESLRLAKDEILANLKPPERAEDATGDRQVKGSEGRCDDLVNIIVLVTANMRSVRSPESKIKAVDLVAWGCQLGNDHMRLHRLLPYLSALVSDEHESPMVRARAIAAITELLALVQHFPPSENQIFLHYLLPTLSVVLRDGDELVCLAYAAALPSLAETALRFLDVVQTNGVRESNGKEEETDASGHEGYDAELSQLQEAFVSIASDMLSGRSAAVKRLLLSDILRLCLVLGREKTNNSLLPLIITVLNDRGDWELRAAFFDNLVGVATFVGRESLQHFILPCIEQALTDMHELVVEGAVRSLAGLVELGLLPMEASLRTAQVSLPLLLHPSSFLRLGVIGFLCALAKQLGSASSYCLLLPLLKPYLRHNIWMFTPEALQDALLSPVSRLSFDRAIEEARRACEGGEESEQMSHARRSGRKAAIAMAAQEATASHGKEEEEEEGEEEKLRVLEHHIRSVAQARLAQQKADEQVVLERRQEQEALASEEWLQEEWDSFFGPPPPAPQDALSAQTGGGGEVARGDGRRKEGMGAFAGMDRGASKANSVKLQRLEWEQIDRPSSVPSSSSSLDTLLGMPLKGEGGGGRGEARAGPGWRPRGVLVGSLGEQRKRIASMVVADDQTFFVTGSEDGVVRVWDAAACFSRDASLALPQLTYSALAGRVQTLTACEGSMSVAAASHDGRIHVVRIDAQMSGGGGEGRNFTGTTTLTTFDYSHEKSVLALAHCRKGSSSLLIAATQEGSIHAHDFRCNDRAWSIEIPPRRGVPVCMSLGNDRNWFVIGTSRGYLLLYDMRFQLDVQWWRHPCQGEIHTVAHCNKLNAAWNSGGPYIVSAGGRNQMSIWDVSRVTCVTHLSATSRGYVSDISNVTCRMGLEGSEPSDDFGLRELDDLSLPEEGVRAVLSSPDGSYLLSGGVDRKIRLWDLVAPDRSFSLGNSPVEGETSVYSSETIRGAGGEVRHIVERRIPSTSAGNVGLKVRAPFAAGSEGRELSWGARGSLAPPAEEHDDTISQLAFLRSRHGSRILSSGWDGSVKVWA